HVSRRVDFAVERHHDTLAARFAGASDADTIKQVHRSVRAQSGIRTLGASHYNRLVAVHGQAQKVGSLFEGIGALNEHCAVNLRRSQYFIHAHGDLPQVIMAGDVPRIAPVHFYARDIADLRQWRQQLFAGQSRIATETIAEQVHAARTHAGQRSWTDHQLDPRQVAIHRPLRKLPAVLRLRLMWWIRGGYASSNAKCSEVLQESAAGLRSVHHCSFSSDNVMHGARHSPTVAACCVSLPVAFVDRLAYRVRPSEARKHNAKPQPLAESDTAAPI